MRTVCIYRLLLVAVAAPLGGCHSFLGIHLSGNSIRPLTQPEQQVAAIQPLPDAKTAEGRTQLANGQVGLSIETFLLALSAGEARGPATNGLGVAYARIGRYDLARRYFEEAIAIDSENVSYTSNLALATRAEADLRSPETRVALGSTTLAPEAVRAVGTLERVSRGEYRIATAAGTVAPAPPLKKPSQINTNRTQQLALTSSAGSRASTVLRSDATPRPGLSKPTSSTLGTLQRISRGEVHIATLTPQHASPGARLALVDQRFRPLVRIDLKRAVDAAPQSYIRLALPETTPLVPANRIVGPRGGVRGAKS